MGGLALGRAGLVLSPHRVPGHHRAHPARGPAVVHRRCRAARARPRRSRPGPGRPHAGARAAPHRPDRSRPVGRGRSGRAGPPGQRAGARAVRGLGRAADGAAGAPRVPHGAELGAGAGRMARGGRQPGRRLGPPAQPGGRGRPRRARRGLPGGERSHLQRGRRGGRARPPGGRALRRGVARPSRGAGGRHRPADGGADAVAGACRLAHPGAGRSPWRGPAQRHLLRGVRPPGPVGPRRTGGACRAAPWSASTTARAARVCWPAATAGSWPAAHGAVPRRRNPAARRCCVARAATRCARSCARPADGCG